MLPFFLSFFLTFGMPHGLTAHHASGTSSTITVAPSNPLNKQVKSNGVRVKPGP